MARTEQWRRNCKLLRMIAPQFQAPKGGVGTATPMARENSPQRHFVEGALPSRSYDFIPADSPTASASVGARRPWPLAVGELDACVRIHLSDFENEASASVGAAQAHPGRLPLVNSTLPQRGSK
jgi:hypothetical protein